MAPNIRIVIVNPSHPGNIGAVARAMKTMELSQLYLVAPKSFPHAQATALAAGADAILAQATITSSLAEALRGTTTIFGTSARQRTLSLPKLSLHEAAPRIVQAAHRHPVAIVFGRENNGLTNTELETCNYHIWIPANPNFNSLNLAAAVQLVAYEIKMASNAHPLPPPPLPEPELANAEALQAFYEELQQVLNTIDFLGQKNPRKILSRLKLLYNRARLTTSEINILRGILTAIQTKIKNYP